MIILGDHDEGTDAWEHLIGVGATIGLTMEPVHFAGEPVGEPFEEGVAMGGGLRGGNSAGVKAEAASLVDQSLFEGDGVHLKWRWVA